MVERPARLHMIAIKNDRVVAKSDVIDNASFKYCDICPMYGITVSSVGSLYLLHAGTR